MFLISMLCLSILTACSTTFQQRYDPWQLPGQPIEVSQFLSGNFQAQNVQFQTALSLTEDRLLLIGIDGMGRRAFELRWDQNGVTTSKAPWMPKELKADFILRDIMLIFWPLEHMADLDIHEEPGKRQLWRDNKLIATVRGNVKNSAWAGTYRIENHVFGYTLNIVSKPSRGTQ